MSLFDSVAWRARRASSLAFLCCLAGPAAPQETPLAERALTEVILLPETDILQRQCSVSYFDPLVIRTPMSGLLTLQVSEGDAVEEGALLASIDATELERELSQSDLRLGYARTRLTRQEDQMQPLREALHEADLAEKDHQIARLQEMRDRLVDLSEEGRISEGQLAEAEDSLAQAIAARETAVLRERIERIEQDLRLEALRHEIAMIELDRNTLLASLEQTRLLAPETGVVGDISEGLRSGDQTILRDGAPLLSIVDPADLSARVRLTEEDMLSVRGAAIQVEQPDRGLTREAELDRIENLDARTFGQKRFEVVLRFDRGETEWAVNTELSCVFFVEGPASGPAVPLSAVRFEEDGPVVFVFKDGELQRRAVELGRTVRGYVQILDGVQRGERVAL